VWKPLFYILYKDSLLDKAYRDSYKMFKLTQKMFLESKRSFRQKDLDDIKIDIYDADAKVNKFERKVRKKVFRHLAERGGDEIYSGLLLISVIIDIERIGDYTKNVLELAKNYQGKLKCDSYEEDVNKIESAVEDSFIRVLKQFEFSEKADAEKLLKEYLWVNKLCDQKATDLITETDKSISSCDAVALALYIRYLKRINSHLRNIATSVINPFDKIGFTPGLKDENH
jgi:phosphate uptake regulator